MKNTLLFVLILFALSCKSPKSETLVSFEVFCEMVANEAKPLALSHPMEPKEADKFEAQLQDVAAKYGVTIHRENDFPVTPLFPASATEGKTVFVICSGKRLVQYQQLKEDIASSTSDKENQIALARRMGRLLGYSPKGINQLLEKQMGIKTLASFEVSQQVTHLYYENLEAASEFYREVLGLPEPVTNRFSIGYDALIELHPTDEKHPADQPKSTAIALLTDQLPAWYAYAQEKEIPIKYTYKPRNGGPHDGFVAIDPGGYLLEFEEFKQHPENELFMAALAAVPKVKTNIDSLYFFGSITWTYHNDLLQMQRFYEQRLGYQLVADQGWTKIYQTSPTGFIGLVDERRGMMDYADEKAIEITWSVERKEEFESFLAGKGNQLLKLGKSFSGPEKYLYRVD